MSNVVTLEYEDEATRSSVTRARAADRKASAEVILFPGVYYCRREDGGAVSTDRPAKHRDWLILTPRG
jgi:hypothetical protein